MASRRAIPVIANSKRVIQFYEYCSAKKSPTVMYVPGFMAFGHGAKSQALIKHFQDKVRYICYDPEGLGESKVEDVDLGTMEFKHWYEDAKAALKTASNEGADKVVLVGSSMGGWFSLRLAAEHPDLVAGLLLIAPAINFIRPRYQAWYDSVSPDVRQNQDAGGGDFMDSSYGTLPIQKAFVESAKDVELERKTKSLGIKCPVRILHGILDDRVPYKTSLEVLDMIDNDDVMLTFLKDGDHRLQGDKHINIIIQALDRLLKDVFPSN